MRSPCPAPQRSTSTSTLTVIDVRPTRERLGVEADDVAEEDRRVELHFAHRLGDVAQRRRLARLDRRRQVDVREDDAAENGAERVGVLRQQQHLDGGNSFGHA